MKFWLSLIFIFLFIIENTAQFRVDGIAPDSIEQLYQTYQAEHEARNYEAADSITGILKSYWTDRLKTDTDTGVVQNYYLSRLLNLDAKFRLRRLPEGVCELVESFEKGLRASLSENNIFFTKYYNDCGLCFLQWKGDIPKSQNYFFKEVEKNRMHFGEESENQAMVYTLLADSYRRQNNLESALEYLTKATQIYKTLKEENSLNYLTAKGTLGIIYYQQGKYIKAKTEFEELYERCEKCGQSCQPLKYIALSNLAECCRNTNEFELAKDYSLKGLNLGKEIFVDRPIKLVQSYITLSNAYTELAENEKAFAMLDTTLQIMNKHNGKNSKALVYHNMASLEDDVNESIKLYEKAIEVCPEDRKCYKDREARYYISLGGSYLSKGKNGLAYNCFQKAELILKQLPDPAWKALAGLYNNLGELAELTGDHDEALTFMIRSDSIVSIIQPNSTQSAFLKSQIALLSVKVKEENIGNTLINDAIKICESGINNRNYRIGKINKNIAKYYLELKQFENARKFAQKSFENFKLNYGEGSYKLNNIKLLILEIEKASGNIEQAYEMLEKISSTCGFDFSDEADIDCVPEFQQWNSLNTLISYLNIEEELKEKSKSAAMQRIRFGIKLIDRLRNQYFFESSEYEFQTKIDEFYNWALQKLIALNQVKKDSEIESLIFECIEKSKSISINRNFYRIRAVENKEVPNHWIEREKLILNKYQQVFERVEDRGNLASDSLLSVYNQEMLAMQDVKQSFMDSLQSTYPKYFSKRYLQSVTSLEDIQNIAKVKNRSFIQTHWGDSLVYILSVLPTQTQVKTVSADKLKTSLLELQTILSYTNEVSNESLYHSNKSEFIAQSHQLYKLIFEGLNEEEISFDLTFIPDGPLVSLPIDILLSKETAPATRYVDLPFLLKTHAVNYLASLTQYKNESLRNRAFAVSSYLGFGPSYGALNDQSIFSSTRSDEERLLLHNISEIENTSDLFDGDNYVGTQATEGAFRNIDASYDILHLAMHAKVDDSIPLDSYLSFASDSSSTHDGKLYVHEIANMNLGHELVVLSACETNKSLSTSGEGILGIAKSFNLAACSSIIMTNWLVDDKSASEIVFNFFEGFKNQKPAAHALRDAKLRFLNSSSMINAHPAYWAPFSFYGYPESKGVVSNYTPWVVGIALFLALIWLFSKYLKKF